MACVVLRQNPHQQQEQVTTPHQKFHRKLMEVNVPGPDVRGMTDYKVKSFWRDQR